MGNKVTCMSMEDPRGSVGAPSKRRSSRPQRKMAAEEEVLHRQALVMAINEHQLSQQFESSTPRRIRSASSRRQELSDSVSHGKQAPVFLGNLEAKKIVLVHGEGFGAWCWYKIIPQLKEAGLQPVALDLIGCGIDHTDTNCIKTLADYSKPLIDYLYNLPEDEKVILVGHSCGGASISYALENYPKKITKAIFICATMVMDGQRPFDVFAEQLGSVEVFKQESKFLLYGNGRDKSPTSLKFDKEQIEELYFNQSPSKDIALAEVSMRPIPLAPIMEKLSLTAENYGSIRRFYIQTLDDLMISPDIQAKLVQKNPPRGVYKIKGSDHCPFFSKPQSLNKLLLEIAQLS